MRYVIKEPFWSRTQYRIYNEAQEEVFQVTGPVFSWGHKLSFQDMTGRELAFINQRLRLWKPSFEIYRDGALFAEMTREFSWFKQRFTLDVPGPNDYVIDGSFWKHDYTVKRAEQMVATVSKTSWTWSETYGVETAAGQDDVTILCAALVVDLVLHDDSAAAGTSMIM